MLFLDFETFNTQDIKVGTYEYARTAEILLTAYAIDDGPAKVWDRTDCATMPDDLRLALNDPDTTITAHNAQFDRAILRERLASDFNLPDHTFAPARWRCTMAKALAHGFNGSLDQLGQVLGLPADQAKLADGKKLIHRFCKPAASNHKADRYTAETHPKEWGRFVDYARRDIDAMREIDRRLPAWNYGDEELALWRLDQTINDRGFAVDVELVEAGANAAAAEKERIAERCRVLTDGLVRSPTKREELRAFLNEAAGLDLEDTQAATLRAVLRGERPLSASIRELIELTLSANKTSTAKYKTLAPAVSPDGRFRGGLQYAGAARTRRWSGRTFQPHNLPSRGLPPQEDVERFIDALKAGAHDLLFDNLMLFGSAALRGALIAPPARRLVCADLSNIEGRALAWLAGEQWKLAAFAAFDRGEGPDLYNITAGSLLGVAPGAVSKTERNVMGKVPELALGYEAGVGGLQTFARGYGVRMADHWDTIRSTMATYVGQARDNRDVWGRQRAPDMDDAEWVASETVKLAWRDRHPATVALWRACSDAARDAVSCPNTTFRAGPRLAFRCFGYRGHRYLVGRLPSGRFLTYFDPRVNDDGVLSYYGVNQLTRQWERIDTYGGKLVENACQSLSRDILASSMASVEADGFDIILTVHDEIVTQAPDEDVFTAERLAAHMATPQGWAEGFPLAAAGFVADRYRK